MYGQHASAAVLPATGLAGGVLLYTSLGLGMLTLGLIGITVASLARKRKHPRP